MKKKVFLILIVAISLILFTNDANAFKHFKQGKYLEKKQWGALEDIIADWKSGKLTTDECAVYGCYVLSAQEPARYDRADKAKLIPEKYKLDKESKEDGPYFFVYFLYNNEDKLGKIALSEFRNSDWCDKEFIDEIASNPKVDNEIGKLLSLPKEKLESIIDQENDFFNVLIYLAQNNIIRYESVYIAAMIQFNDRSRFNNAFENFMKRNKLMDYHGHFGLIPSLCEKCKNVENRKSINVFNFHFKYLNLMKKLGSNRESYYKNGFEVSFGTYEENKYYCELFNQYYEIMCNENKFNMPLNFYYHNTLEILLSHSSKGADPGVTTPIQSDNNTYESVTMSIDVGLINESIKEFRMDPVKTIIHELFHSIQYSYLDNSRKFFWFISLNAPITRRFAETTAVWAEDYFYRPNPEYEKYLEAILQSRNYFFLRGGIGTDQSGYKFSEACFFKGDPYCLGFFWNYVCRLYDNNSIKSILNILVKEYPLTAMRLFMNGDSNFTNTLHNFNIKNFFISKQKGADAQEQEFKNAAKNWAPLPEFEIREDLIPELLAQTSTQSVTIDPLATKFVKLTKNGNFENSTTINFSWAGINAQCIKISVIPKWYDIDKNEVFYGYKENQVAMNPNTAFYKYYTKKGLNPKYFIMAITNSDINPVKIDITVDISSPETSISSKILSATAQDFEKNIGWLVANDNLITNIKNSEADILNIYSKYKSGTNADHIFYGHQLYQKLTTLNLFMETAVNQIHDLRYQYYLIKEACVKSILNNVNSTDLTPQINNFTKFIKEVAALAGNNNNSIEIFNGWAIIYHVDTQLKILKPITSWTQAEFNAMNSANDAMKKISNAISNPQYVYKYTNEELQESLASPIVGMTDDELPGNIVTPPLNGPFQVNLCPNIKNIFKATGIPYTYKFSTDFKNLTFESDGTPYSSAQLLFTNDTFDPLSLKYFSSIKVHAYHESNMPPKPNTTNMKEYVSAIGYYMKICRDYATCENKDIVNTRYIMVGGASKQITEIISLLVDAIIQEKKEGKNVLYTTLTQELSSSANKAEILELLDKQLKKDGFRE